MSETKEESSDVICLYRFDHDILNEFKERKSMIFFSKISGLLCHLKFSKHKDDDNIFILCYKLKIRPYQLLADQQKIRLTIFPQISSEFKQEGDDEHCGKIKDIKLGDFNLLNVREVNAIDDEFGSVLILNSEEDSFFLNVLDLQAFKISPKEMIKKIGETKKIKCKDEIDFLNKYKLKDDEINNRIKQHNEHISKHKNKINKNSIEEEINYINEIEIRELRDIEDIKKPYFLESLNERIKNVEMFINDITDSAIKAELTGKVEQIKRIITTLTPVQTRPRSQSFDGKRKKSKKILLIRK